MRSATCLANEDFPAEEAAGPPTGGLLVDSADGLCGLLDLTLPRLDEDACECTDNLEVAGADELRTNEPTVCATTVAKGPTALGNLVHALPRSVLGEGVKTTLGSTAIDGENEVTSPAPVRGDRRFSKDC